MAIVWRQCKAVLSDERHWRGPLEDGMWIELIVAVCLYSDPTACRELNFQFTETKSLNRCMAEAQPYLASWAGTHPKWRIVRWRCAHPGSSGRRI